MARKPQYPKNNLKQNKWGGSAAAGGMNFQACVTAIVAVHVARGTPLGWLNGIVADVPVTFKTETGGSGDDMCLQLNDGSVTEIQVKKGLTAGKNLWDTLLSLASAIDSGAISYGVLVVSPDSSGTIRNELAMDIIRMGQGRTDDLKSLSQKFKLQLFEKSFDVEKITARLRIVTVHALETDAASIQAAHAELGHLCENVQNAWDHLYRDSHWLIELRGQRSARSVLQLLQSAGISLRYDNSTAPLIVLHKLSNWVVEANAAFSIFGIDKSLPLETAWIEMKALVQVDGLNEANNLEEALKRYHSWNSRSVPTNVKQIDSITLGQFVRRGVVIAGPGMGKTTLLKRLGIFYAKSGHPVLQVRLRDIAARMRSSGIGFADCVLELGLDGSGIHMKDLSLVSKESVVLLCDGLDECGNAQIDVVQGLLRFASGYPQCRILVTTRPIGYDSSLLRAWRHYELVPLESSKTKQHISKLLAGIFDERSSELTKALTFAEGQLKLSHVETVATKSPMLLGFLVALSLKSKSVGATRTQLYKRLFELIEEAPSQRHEDGEVGSVVMMRFLEMLGWHLLVNPHESLEQILERCAKNIAAELHEPILKAKAICEQCASRWQDLGMLERVRFQTDEAITFVHKTFSEYAAAKHLVHLEPKMQNNVLSTYSKNASWNETIKFSCSMGLAESAVDAVITTIPQGKLDTKAVNQAVEFLNDCDVKVSSSVIERLIDTAWECVLSPRRWDALQAGFSLFKIASKYPEEVCARAKNALSHQQPWTRLSAWACVTAAGSQYFDYQAMLDMLKVLPSDDYRFRRLHEGRLLLNDPRPKIIEGFILSATKAILTRDADPIGLAVLDAILIQNIGHTIGFRIEIAALLKPYGKLLPRDYSLDWKMPWLTPDLKESWQDHHISLLNALDDPTVIVNIDEPIDDNSLLMHMSGFMDASSYWEISAGDIWKWNFGIEAEAIKAVLHAIATVSGVERDQLIRDVRILKARLEKQVDDDLLFYDSLVHVDTQPNWELASQLPISLENLEITLFQQSDWLIVLATNLLQQKATKDQILPIIRRLLEKGKANTLLAAAHLMSHIDVADALLLIRNRLLDTMSDGCEALFEKLGELDNVMEDKDILQYIENGLLCMNPKVAISATELASKVAVSGTTDITTLIRKAYCHWQVHEEPYPVSGGVIPDSPRSLLAKAMLLADVVDDTELISMASDSRSDVKDVSKESLNERLNESESLRDLFLSEILNGKLELDLLSNALKKKTQFSPNQCVLIRTLLQHDNPMFRYAAIPILAEPYSTVAEIKQHLQILSQDSEADIREIARELSAQ
ncbi:NACHT domain-containing protein [Methylosarcina fibrata]|uniref:NACHT domain-containing protein n=1 Tax=Methylosarcina fibrata TaxID=105972 RepID=UPI00036423A4|nr:NACHT domain-containing protein [Methylosarcina fibrata]